LTRFVSNSTDVLASLLPSLSNPETAILPWHAQLIPTLLYRNQTTRKGELWRGLIVIDQLSEEQDEVWDDFCITDIDLATYGEVPINEIAFWSDDNGKIAELEWPAFRVKLKRTKEALLGMATREDGDIKFVVQT
jgi:hypothetical protein